ncbi:MAG TPA: UDP-N-acetylmuramoyl-tripeptide--D-alanyl-D-alanine ligase [Polyangiaceae bacterium]
MATPIPENRASFQWAELAEVTRGLSSGSGPIAVSGVTSDSRRVRPGNLFAALPGEHFDGHAFVEQAVRAGATGVLVERPVAVPAGVGICQVPSVLAALADLARYHRQRLACKVIAVAGSAGKTTTKTLIAAALEAVAPGRVHSTPGNLNNAVGVPFVLFGLEPQHRFLVVEIGTNRLGEVEQLARAVKPDVGVLTLIGLEHTEGLGDIDSIEAEEAALLFQVPTAGSVVFNADDFRVRRQALHAPARTKIGYGRDALAAYRLVKRVTRSLHRAELELERPDGSRVVLESPLLGEAGALAVSCAFAVAELCRGSVLEPAELNARFGAAAASAEGRLALTELRDGSVVIDDSYNSNPASVRSSLSVAAELAGQRGARLLLVLGEMLELGPLAVAEHRRLGEDLATVPAAFVVAVAGHARELVAPARAAGIDAEFAEAGERALSLVLDRMQPRDVVLVKASRGVRAEGVVRGIIAAKGASA